MVVGSYGKHWILLNIQVYFCQGDKKTYHFHICSTSSTMSLIYLAFYGRFEMRCTLSFTGLSFTKVGWVKTTSKLLIKNWESEGALIATCIVCPKVNFGKAMDTYININQNSYSYWWMLWKRTLKYMDTCRYFCQIFSSNKTTQIW